MHTVYLLLGSNLGNRWQYFADAEQHINQNIGMVSKSSSVYETAPWGFTQQPAFLNKVIRVETTLTPQQLLNKIIEIEIKLGRVRTEKWHERTIDIDILFFDDAIINHDHLKIPHPHLQQRRFTLMPLNQIAPQLLHPVLQKTIRQLLDECNDDSHVEEIVP